ncbi:DUF932 domain-containing protein [Burkholderia multivorans]|uniref:DUF932 domain-containing protein n=1 Tax=Burkholderia multivorans TaxID=87883 RepID=UPI00057D46BF|nr:DUF932 domain-containing protein [Burkholderia multivorans]KHS09458.1 hypothetical protein BMD20_29690 [Burkholderia multivorans]KHS10408.1 hypothetical protein BMD22_28135 [Burkholderia multivorans]MDR9230289.1 hypothetical protein [Burkholderia multivorans]HDR9474966.1 DUF945 domain-containing protein [Burkholderia multivorans]HDR9480777.1 DUF945 domain-containing protein [Burkholderia multivorans]
MRLASRFAYNAHQLRADVPLSDDQIARVAPSIFATEKHESRSARYTYIPTIEVLNGLRGAGFQPFMVAQTRVRDSGKREHTKHMIRLRHADQIVGDEADEIILLNSHDGTSSYQMIAGQFRFVCANGMVCGKTASEIRVPHKGQIVDEVIQGAFDVLDGFEYIREVKDEMKSIVLSRDEQMALATAALQLKYEPSDVKPAPITESQALEARRFEDRKDDLWTTFNRLQENLIQRGGLPARTASGRTTRTRPVEGIDQNVKLNRALWTLTEAMAALKK